MPRWIDVKKSGVHRAACFALYRALLRQQHQLPFSEQQRSVIGKKIRKGFQKNVNIQSPPNVIAALRLGYSTLETLQKRGPDWHDTLNRALGLEAHQPKDLVPKPAPKHAVSTNQPTTQLPKPKLQKPRVWPHPNATPVLSRPFKTVSGRRGVPYLINANNVPFLRIKKPQPPFLSRIIRDTILSHEHRLSRAREIEDSLSYANDENSWDAILERNCGVSADREGGGWETCIRETWGGMMRMGKVHQKRRLELAQRMYGVVVEEKRLAEVARKARVQARRKAYRERRGERRAKKEVEARE